MGDEEMVKMLIRWEPQLWHQRDLNGMLPIHWSCARGFAGVTNQLALDLSMATQHTYYMLFGGFKWGLSLGTISFSQEMGMQAIIIK